MAKNIIDLVRERTILLNKVDENIEKREQRVEKLKDKNWYIAEAAPEYKESYTKR